MSHTPGPWKQAPAGPNGCPIIGSHGMMVCMLAHSINEPHQFEEATSNARLIAAAPELLETLKDILRIAKAASMGMPTNQTRCDRGDAAIAKAEGK